MAGELTGHGVSSVLWSFATMGESPGDSLMNALRLRSLDLLEGQRLGGGAQGGVKGVEGFSAQGISNCFWAYAILGEMPGETLLVALSQQARLCEHEFTPQVRPLPDFSTFANGLNEVALQRKHLPFSSFKHP